MGGWTLVLIGKRQRFLTSFHMDGPDLRIFAWISQNEGFTIFGFLPSEPHFGLHTCFIFAWRVLLIHTPISDAQRLGPTWHYFTPLPMARSDRKFSCMRDSSRIPSHAGLSVA